LITGGIDAPLSMKSNIGSYSVVSFVEKFLSKEELTST
jgi:hypothetical protein